jgi:hypothetical protein
MQKLPVLRVAREAYVDVLTNWRGLLRVGGAWLLVPWGLGLAAAAGAPFLGFLASAVMAVGLAAVAVAWHRHVLLGEPLNGPFAAVDARVGRYLLWTILLGLLMSLPVLIMAPILGPALEGGAGPGAADAGEGPGLLMLALPVISIALIWAVTRLQLVFPGTAIDQKGLNLARSWQMTRGQGLRLILALMLAALPVAIASILLVLLFAGIADATGSIIMRMLADLAGTASAWVQAPIVASLLSYTYLFLRGQTSRVDAPGAD